MPPWPKYHTGLEFAHPPVRTSRSFGVDEQRLAALEHLPAERQAAERRLFAIHGKRVEHGREKPAVDVGEGAIRTGLLLPVGDGLG